MLGTRSTVSLGGPPIFMTWGGHANQGVWWYDTCTIPIKGEAGTNTYNIHQIGLICIKK